MARAAQTAARFRDPYGYGDSLRSERILRVEAPLAQPDLKAHGGPRPAVLAVVLLSLAAGGAGGLLGVGLFDASEPSVVAVVTSGDDATAAENDVPTAPMAAAEDSIAAESLLPAGDVGVDGGKPLLPAGSDDKPGLKGTPIAATVRDAPAELPAAVSEGAISRALPITWTEPDTIAESPAPLVDPLRQTTSLSYAREDRDARAVSPRVAILSSMASGSDPSKDHPLVANENENFATVKTAVNMRAKPNNNATVVTVLSSRRKVQIIECDYWCELIADGKHGYVFRKFLDRSAMGVVSAR